GNLTEEPIAKDNAEALRRLAPLADAFLLHNRDIYARYDDSVWQVIPFSPQSDIIQPVRRARGYAPYPIRLPFKMRRILATGPLLKNTFCLTRDHYAFLSQHIGDMENLDTLEHYEAALETYKHLFRLEPQEIVCDMHPDYLTTEIAIRYAQEQGLPAPLQVQHHHAHIAACLADNGWLIDAGPVIGVALDGTGYGPDGAIWGAEWLVAGYNGFERAAHLEYLPLPGGDAATRNPWRIAVAYLHTLLGPEAYPVGMFCPGESAMLRQQIERRINTPETSSMGRLFDAVSALLGICHQATYEAQAAIELEQAAGIQIPEDISPYAFEIEGDTVRVAVLFEALLAELRKGTPVAEISRRFHATIAYMVVKVSAQIRDTTGLNTVALSGGVFQNRLLLQLSLPLLEKAGFKVLRHRQVPCNDGGVSLGQAVIAQSQEPVF
ncbi:MAG: carbamoyltransferase HypF, partial [Anaerolineae bacterium]|nr:carbamoyltransferase HypF [Anaerolineae bacterium]